MAASSPAGPLGPELEVALLVPERGSRRTRREVYDQLRAAIRAGRLAAGLRMPASRQLAQRLGVSRNTVIAVYELLVSEGCLVARAGSGTFVAAESARGSRPRPAVDMAGRVPPAWREGWSPPRLPPRAQRMFLVGSPDLDAFPWPLWRRLANRTLHAYGRARGPPAGPQGLHALREAIAAHLSFARGIACRAEDIVVTAGAQQAFDLLAKVLVHRPGVVVAVEDPGYAPVRIAFAAAGARVVGAPVDEEGIVVEALPAGAEVIYVTPSHQFPLGVPMSPRRRQALLAFARRTGAIVIEDDYDGEFRFDGRPLEALQTLDVTEQVIYLGTFSKSLFPDLRLGFVAAPQWAVGALAAAKQVSGSPSQIAQQTLATFIAEGHLVRHVRRMRRIYAERRRALFAAIEQAPRGWLEPFPSAAGLHLSLRLPAEADSEAFVEAAAELGAGTYRLAQFGFGGPCPNGLVLGYGALAEADVRLGGLALAQAARLFEADDDAPGLA
jgi:GntR family transcriptional regulator/MocR family aminotransferase